MSKYHHPLLQEADYSQAKDPAMEMMLALYQQQESVDLNAYLTKPFETPLFDEVVAIRLDEGNEQFEFVRKDGKTWFNFKLSAGCRYLRLKSDVSPFVITTIDSRAGLAGGYYFPYTGYTWLVFDRLEWEALGQPLDGRGFSLEYANKDWLPVVVGKDGAFLLCNDEPSMKKKMVPYFPDQQTANKLAADFSLRSINPQECRLVSAFDLQVVEAVRKQSGWEEFSFADWQKAQADMKMQLRSCSDGTWLQLSCILPLPIWGAVDQVDDLHLGLQIPGQGWKHSGLRPFKILHEYAQAKRKSDFYQKYSKEKLLTAIEIICAGLGIRSNLKLKDVPYLVSEWGDASDVWFGGNYSRLAQTLVDHRLTPPQYWPMRSPNVHLLSDDEIGQWLPADFKITEQNQEGFLAFVHGLLYDLRDLTTEQTATCFEECLCSKQAHEVYFEKIDGDVQLLDLMADGYFDRGRLRWALHGGAVMNHARMRYNHWHWDCKSYRSLPFSWKEQVTLDGLVFRLSESEADWADGRQYCGLQEVAEMPLDAGRVPPVIVSLADSPRVPIGIVEPLSTEFELSEEFYETLSEPKERFNLCFQQLVEQYWEIFDKKYPYLY